MTQVTPATEALAASGIDYELTEHGPVGSLEEAAAARGLEPWRIIKTIVVRRGEGDFIFVLVPGDREISWPKLRSELGVNRLSMPDKDVARDVTKELKVALGDAYKVDNYDSDKIKIEGKKDAKFSLTVSSMTANGLSVRLT